MSKEKDFYGSSKMCDTNTHPQGVKLPCNWVSPQRINCLPVLKKRYLKDNGRTTQSYNKCAVYI